MPDFIINERLELIVEHADVIIERMQMIPNADWFVSDKDGARTYDSIIARLQPIGENIKKIEKIEPGFIEKELSINADNIIRFRDLISHHYELLDRQIIFNICTEEIPKLHQKIKNYLNLL